MKIVGVSADSVEKQKAFVEKQKITVRSLVLCCCIKSLIHILLNMQYTIISDEGGEVRQAYSIGKHMFGPSTRTTFVIDSKGIVR